MKKILIGPSTFAVNNESLLTRLKLEDCEVFNNPYGRKLSKQELIDLLPGVSGLIAGLETLDREVLELSELKVISRCGAGIENVDLKAAKELGINVYSTPDAPTSAVAELTIGALISLLRFIPQMNSDLHSGKWNKRIGSQLSEKTVAIIGYGRIGRLVAKFLRPFNVKILAVDPYIESKEIKSVDVEMVALAEALTKADIIILHATGKKEIFGENEFKQMKKGAFLLNSARGSLVSETALISAIKDGTVCGAWLDTFGEEPYKGPLCQYEQVLLTPHVGSYSRECRIRMESEAVSNLITGFRELKEKGSI